MENIAHSNMTGDPRIPPVHAKFSVQHHGIQAPLCVATALLTVSHLTLHPPSVPCTRTASPTIAQCPRPRRCTSLPWVAPGLAAEEEPGLTVWSLMFNGPLKTIGNIFCCVCLVKLRIAPVRPRPPSSWLLCAQPSEARRSTNPVARQGLRLAEPRRPRGL